MKHQTSNLSGHVPAEEKLFESVHVYAILYVVRVQLSNTLLHSMRNF